MIFDTEDPVALAKVGGITIGAVTFVLGAIGKWILGRTLKRVDAKIEEYDQQLALNKEQDEQLQEAHRQLKAAFSRIDEMREEISQLRYRTHFLQNKLVVVQEKLGELGCTFINKDWSFPPKGTE